MVAAALFGCFGRLVGSWRGDEGGRPGGGDDRCQIDGVDLDVFAGLGCLDDLAVAEVHDDVAGVRGCAVGAGGEEQVARLDLGEGDLRAVLPAGPASLPSRIPGLCLAVPGGPAVAPGERGSTGPAYVHAISASPGKA
jgi:hypothetical protein